MYVKLFYVRARSNCHLFPEISAFSIALELLYSKVPTLDTYIWLLASSHCASLIPTHFHHFSSRRLLQAAGVYGKARTLLRVLELVRSAFVACKHPESSKHVWWRGRSFDRETYTKVDR